MHNTLVLDIKKLRGKDKMEFLFAVQVHGGLKIWEKSLLVALVEIKPD